MDRNFQNHGHILTTDLASIARYANEREKENEQFRLFLLASATPDDTDARVHKLNRQAEAAIDCTSCGNCCRSLMINVTGEEITSISTALQLSANEFRNSYIEESLQGQFIINTIPCHFLRENKCTVYEHRFTECRDFPHLHKPGFVRRFSGTIMHYGSCPIIYNVIELLKQEMGFDFAREE